MKVVIDYVTFGKGGGHITLTEDVSDMPRLPEVGEIISIVTRGVHGRSGNNWTYVVESIDWEIENTSLSPTPDYDVTMRIHCQSSTTKNPTQT